MKLIPGEKNMLKTKENELGRKLTRKERRIEHQKAKRKFIIGTILGLGGALTVAGGVKAIGEHTEAKNDIQAELETEENLSFSEKYAVSVEQLNHEETPKKNIEEEIEQLENKQEILNYIKNMYIESYEEQTGDNTLTTADIKIKVGHESYIYMDNNTKEIITHGEKPDLTIQMLEENNVSYSAENCDLEKIYKVYGKDGKIIDCMTFDGEEATKVIPGDQYSDMKEYKSTFVEMGKYKCKAFEEGVNYFSNYDNKDKDVYMKRFIRSSRKSTTKPRKKPRKRRHK